jgi:hypothetical protein
VDCRKLKLLKEPLIVTNEVIRVCSSNSFIEQQAYEMSKEIKKDSIYKFIREDYSEAEAGYITKVILEDKDGTVYSIEPNPIGVKFARGEITFKEYKKLQKRDTLNVMAIFSGVIVLFGGFMFGFMKYLV